jgi:hypothetical protein
MHKPRGGGVVGGCLSALGVLALVLFVGVVASVNCVNHERRVEVAAANAARAQLMPSVEQPPAPVEPPQPYPLLASEMGAEFKKNELAAETKYAHLRRTVLGVVANVRVPGVGDPYVAIGDGLLESLRCSFDKDDARQFMALESGQLALVSGVVRGRVLHSVVLDECALVGVLTDAESEAVALSMFKCMGEIWEEKVPELRKKGELTDEREQGMRKLTESFETMSIETATERKLPLFRCDDMRIRSLVACEFSKADPKPEECSEPTMKHYSASVKKLDQEYKRKAK